MNHALGRVVLRRPEPRDILELYRQKNDPVVATLLGGVSLGYSEQDIREWVEFHRKRSDEVIWVVAAAEDDRCLGHAGFYQIDYRARVAEFAIMLGEKSIWGQGVGSQVARFCVEQGFSMLNLNRIHLTVLASNDRARKLYQALGFVEEGYLREAQYKNGKYEDVVVMGLLRADHGGLR